MTKFTIKEVVEKYKEYLKTQNLKEKDYIKYLKKFKIDLVDRHIDCYLINQETVNSIFNKLIETDNKILVDENQFYNFLFNGNEELEYHKYK